MTTLDAQVHAAKTVLLQTSTVSKKNLYDHLCDCLAKVLEERPENAADVFETLSERVKKENSQNNTNLLQDQEGPSQRLDVANEQKPLFEVTEKDADVEADEEVSVPFPDLMDIARHFEEGGIGLGRDETFHIFLALKKLSQEQPLASVRFWGKVFGTEANYIVAETEFQEGEGEEEEEEEEKEEGEAAGEGEGGEGGDGEDDGEEEADEIPKSQWKPPHVIPKEEPKTGANKKTYFVCNKPGEQWLKLPCVKPKQIAAAREIRKLFTGRLEAPVITFPPFPGREENYLRAQIARISAATHISPESYFQFEEEEEEPEEGAPGVIEVNKEFEITKISDYLDLGKWVHHIPYILPQVENLPSWSARLTSSIMPHYAVAIVSSNLWPGAHAFTFSKMFENIYVGWGLKYTATPFNPLLPPPVQDEFPSGADITETTDPTVEQEAALRVAQEEAQAKQDEEEEVEDSDDD